ncbi:MAG: iron-sulfur cluster assembly accessory protein [Filomicrobium sp.]
MTAPSRLRPKVMTLTDSAAARVASIMANKPDVVALKLGVKKGGCAGMEYTMDWADEIGQFDEVVEEKGVKLVIDPMAIMYLLGTEMDYQESKMSSGFVFNNPNQQSACGCGESVELVPAAPERVAEING